MKPGQEIDVFEEVDEDEMLEAHDKAIAAWVQSVLTGLEDSE